MLQLLNMGRPQRPRGGPAHDRALVTERGWRSWDTLFTLCHSQAPSRLKFINCGTHHPIPRTSTRPRKAAGTHWLGQPSLPRSSKAVFISILTRDWMRPTPCLQRSVRSLVRGPLPGRFSGPPSFLVLCHSRCF